MTRTLHSDHEAGHRPLPVSDLDHGLATATIALGVLGLVLVAVDLELAGTWVGIIGMAVGLAAQMFSRTRAERFVDMAGLLVCFLAFATGASQGGLY